MRLLFLLLLISTQSLGQIGYGSMLMRTASKPAEQAVTEIASVSYDFDKIYYYETETIDLVATPDVGVLSSSWQIRDMETNELVGLSFGNTANISTVSEIGWYKISYDAVTVTDRIHQEWDDILILDRRFTREEADVIVNMASGNYYNDFASADNTGLKIWVENSGTGYCYLGNLWGSPGFDNYVRVQADYEDGLIQTGIAGSTGIGMSGSRYFIVDGHFEDKTVGAWEVRQPENGTFDLRMGPEEPFTNGIFTGLKFNRQGYTDNAAISLIAGYSQTWNAVTWVVEDMAVHDCWIENAGAEAAYWGFTDDRIFSGSPDFQPVKFRRFIFAWNTIINSGNDGIQPCNSINQRIHDNYVNGVGLATNQFHETGTSYNAGNSGDYYNNFIKNAKMFMTMDTGLCPGCDLYAGDSTLRPSNFYNNVFVTGTFPSGGVTESGAIYIQYRAGYMGTGELDWNFWNNTFVTSASKELMNIYFSTDGLTNPDFLMVNNIVVSNPTGGDYNEVDFIGPGTQPTSEVINNLYYDNGNEAPILFTDTTNLNYRPSSLSSTAFTGSPEDVGAIVGTPLRDADGFIITYNYYGAYSRSDLSTIDPSLEDEDPAAFDTALSVENETDTGGDIEFEADKEGLLYWAIVANDATAPTVQELIDGGFGITSGIILGALSPSMGSFTGLTVGTAYDLYGVFVTIEGVAQASATKVDFTTAADVTAPTLSGWYIDNTNKDRIYFSSSEIITATTVTGFTVANPTKTISSVTINSGQTTGHYFTVSAAFTASDDIPPTIAYSGGSNFQDASSNALATFSATNLTPITKAAAQDIVWTSLTNATDSGGGTMTSTGAPNSGKSTQVIPSTSDGELVFDSDVLLNTPGSGAIQVGIMLSSSSLSYANIILAISFGSTSVSTWENDVYKAAGFYSGGGIRDAGVKYIVKIDRATQRLLWYSEVSGVRTLRYTSEGTYSGNMCVGFFAQSDTTTQITNGKVQAYNGF